MFGSIKSCFYETLTGGGQTCRCSSDGQHGILLLVVAEDNVLVSVAVDVCDGDGERVLLVGARELNRRLEAVVAVAQEQLRLLLGRGGSTRGLRLFFVT